MRVESLDVDVDDGDDDDDCKYPIVTIEQKIEYVEDMLSLQE